MLRVRPRENEVWVLVRTQGWKTAPERPIPREHQLWCHIPNTLFKFVRPIDFLGQHPRPCDAWIVLMESGKYLLPVPLHLPWMLHSMTIQHHRTDKGLAFFRCKEMRAVSFIHGRQLLGHDNGIVCGGVDGGKHADVLGRGQQRRGPCDRF